VTYYPIHALSGFPPLYFIRNSEPVRAYFKNTFRRFKRAGLLQKAKHKLLVHVQRIESSQKPKRRKKRKAAKKKKKREKRKKEKREMEVGGGAL